VVPIVVQVVPPRVTHHERQIVLQAAMEENVATSSGSPHTPSTTATTGGVPPPNSPSQVQTTMVSTASTSGSGLILSMAAITAPFTQSATGPPFSYGMPDFDTNSVLTYSTLQTMGLGAGSSNAPLQGSMGGTSAPYNAFPYGGGHIPPSSPSLGGASQQPVWPNMNYNLFGAGSQGPSSNTTSVGSLSFSLFVHLVTMHSHQLSSRPGETLVLDHKILCRVLFLHRGKTPLKDPGICGRDQSPRQGCRPGETPSMVNGTPGKAQYLCPSDRQGETLSRTFGTQRREKSLPSPQCPTTGVSR
jgi:hypothetical protein